MPKTLSSGKNQFPFHTEGEIVHAGEKMSRYYIVNISSDNISLVIRMGDAAGRCTNEYGRMIYDLYSDLHKLLRWPALNLSIYSLL